jgi:predicted pyridoxine 5'-phosphate oxidase superfamily flavin-nucleotide-binding protein
VTYHDGARELQDRFGTRALADRLHQRLGRAAFTEEDRAFIESRAMFFLATADADGQPDCSYKGGMLGFVRVVGPAELAFPSYDGNGMFRSLGNIARNPRVGLLFLDFEQPRRLRVNGRAALDFDAAGFDGAQLVVRVQAERVFPNCPRYLHRLHTAELSAYAPAPGRVAPVPAWKRMPAFMEVLPAGDPARE